MNTHYLPGVKKSVLPAFLPLEAHRHTTFLACPESYELLRSIQATAFVRTCGPGSKEVLQCAGRRPETR